MRLRIIITLTLVFVGCSDEEPPLSHGTLGGIPSPVQLPARPLLDTDLTFYSYFTTDDGTVEAKRAAEAKLSTIVEAGFVISQAWLGTTQECSIAELVNTARLVVRLKIQDSRMSDFGFVADPVPASFEFPWIYWYACDERVVWRYDFNPGPDVEVPEPTQVPNEYPIPDSPTKYYRPWYVWEVTEEEWRAGVEAFIEEVLREGIALKQVSVPIRPMDSCSQSEWPNTDVVIIETLNPLCQYK